MESTPHKTNQIQFRQFLFPLTSGLFFSLLTSLSPYSTSFWYHPLFIASLPLTSPALFSNQHLFFLFPLRLALISSLQPPLFLLLFFIITIIMPTGRLNPLSRRGLTILLFLNRSLLSRSLLSSTASFLLE